MPLGKPFVAGLLVQAGVAHAWSAALPWSGQSAWWLQLLSLGVLLACLERTRSAGLGAWQGWLFAASWFCGSFWWLFISMHVYGGLPSPLAALAVLLLAAALALYLGAASAAYVAWAPAGLLPRALYFSCLWLLVELARARWFTGFPWGASGYSHVDGPLAGLAPWIGVFGIGAVAAFLSALLALAAVRWYLAPRDPAGRMAPGRAALLPMLVPLLALGFVALGLGVASWSAQSLTRAAGQINVALLQGNIPQDEKFRPGSGVPQALRWYSEQLLAADQQLVVAPETAIPLLIEQLPPGYWSALEDRFAQGEQAALIGIPARNSGLGYSNSVIGLKPSAPTPYRYDKHHLVPFGEFIPPFFRWFTEMMQIPLGDFHRGALHQPSFEWSGQRIAPNICYEDLFGEELAQRFADDALAPTIFANLSNIAWFGDSIAIDQHLNISRLRALEFQRPFVRATNTGATVIINHRGQVTHALERHTRGVLRGQVQGREGSTPYARWVARWSLWPLWLIGCLAVMLTLAQRWRGAGIRP